MVEKKIFDKFRNDVVNMVENGKSLDIFIQISDKSSFKICLSVISYDDQTEDVLLLETPDSEMCIHRADLKAITYENDEILGVAEYIINSEGTTLSLILPTVYPFS